MFRRVVTGLIAAIILLLSLFAVAMAASPEFREAVFNFFHIRTEDVTEHSPVENHELPIEESNVSENDVQIHVTVTRVRVPANGRSVNGLFLICSDEIEYNQGNRYDVYTQQGGELVKLESHAVHVTETRFGKTFRFDFEWASDGKNTAIGYVRTPDGSSDDGDYRIQFLTGHPYEALVLLTNESGGLYPLLMDLNTSALTDFAASIDMNRVGGITAWGYSNNGRLLDLSMSGDLTRLVFRNPEGTVFYGNLTTGELDSRFRTYAIHMTCLDYSCEFLAFKQSFVGSEKGWERFLGVSEKIDDIKTDLAKAMKELEQEHRAVESDEQEIEFLEKWVKGDTEELQYLQKMKDTLD